MPISSPLQRLQLIWRQLYPDMPANQQLLNRFVQKLSRLKAESAAVKSKPGWQKNMVVYALYVDQFARNFNGLIKRLDHITNLGCNTIWLLPILKSPGLDQGFDISDYQKVRADLGGNQAFYRFLKIVGRKNLQVIFDISINHTSNQHPWFRQNRDFYIWSKNRNLYTYPNRVIFPHDPADPNLDLEDPRQKWVWEPKTKQYYYRTFYRHQPDLNYRNPQVLLAMSQVIAFWASKGVAGFRADAAPFLWKENGKLNESLPQTHLILRFFQATAQIVNPDSFLLAEACQKPAQLLAYLRLQECRLAYHFPRMVSLWSALLTQNNRDLVKDIQTTPKLSTGCQWLMFLRLHDELSLEMINPKTRRQLYQLLIKNGLDFRNGHGVSGRLASFLDSDPKKILFAWALLLIQPGTPLIFQGDAEGQTNNFNYYRKMKQATGQDDTRLVNRGPLAWGKVNHRVYNGLKQLIQLYRQYHFGQAKLQLIKENSPYLFSCWREFKGQKVLCRYNFQDYSFTWSRVKTPPAKVDNWNKKFSHEASRHF